MKSLLQRILAGLLFMSPNLQADVNAGEIVKEISLKHISKAAKRWSVDDGLPSDQIYSITQTPDGHIWVADRRSVARLSNKSFDALQLGSSKGSIKEMFSDSQGTVWLFFSSGKIATTRHGKFEPFMLETGLNMRKIQAIIPNRTAGKGGAILFEQEPDALRIHRISHQGSDEIARLSEVNGEVVSAGCDTDGSLWFVTDTQRLYALSDSKLVSVPSPHSEQSRWSTIALNRKGQLSICDHHGIYTLEQDKIHWSAKFHTRFPDEAKLQDCVVDAEGNTWIKANDNDIFICKPDGQRYQLNLSANGFAPPALKIYADATGTIWIGSFRGLIQIAYSPFVTWEVEMDSVPYRLISITEDANHDMWFACAGAVCYLDRDDSAVKFAIETEVIDLTSSVKGSPIGGALVLLKTGDLYLVQKDSQKLLNQGLSSKIKPDKITIKGNITTPEGDHWVPTTRGLFYRKWSPEKSPYLHIPLPDPVGFGPLQTAYQGPDGKIHIAATNQGIYTVNPLDQTWARLSEPDDQAAKSTFAIHVDPANRVWSLSGKERQLSLHDNEQHWYASYQNLGFDQTSLASVITDLEGGIWFSTSKDGVAYARVDALIHKMQHPDASLELVWFDRTSGLGTKACSFTTFGLCRSRDGSIWVANTNGVSVINPSLWEFQRAQAKDFPVHIKACLLDDVPAQEIDESFLEDSHAHAKSHRIVELNVPAGIQKIEIQYASINHTFMGSTRYHFRLKGFDRDWIEVGTRSSAIYQNLPHGTYRFEVAAQHPNGNWSVHPSSIALNIEPHWYQLLAVRAAIAIGLIAIATYIYQLRVSYLKKRSLRQESFTRQLIDSQEEERKRIANEFHDSLGQDLLIIKNSTELAKRQLEDGSPLIKRLSDISDITAHAIKEARSITSNLRPAELDHLGLRVAVQSMIHRVGESSGLEIHTELTALEHDWPENQEINIYRILQEGLSNAIKHAHACNIEVMTSVVTHGFTMDIRDDGIGFDSAAASPKSSGLGIDSLHERARLLDGKLTITTAPGKGTHLKIEFPLKN